MQKEKVAHCQTDEGCTELRAFLSHGIPQWVGMTVITQLLMPIQDLGPPTAEFGRTCPHFQGYMTRILDTRAATDGGHAKKVLIRREVTPGRKAGSPKRHREKKGNEEDC